MKEDVYLNPKANRVYLEGAVDGYQITTSLKKVEYRPNVGILIYGEGASFPNRGMKPEDAENILQRNNIFKAVFMGMLKLRPNIVSFLEYFIRIGEKTLDQYLPKELYQSVFARELEDIVYDFFFSLTSNEVISRRFAKFLTFSIDSDEPYRARVTDLASETSKEKLLKHPIREVRRLIGILADRETVHKEVVSNKFRSIGRLLCLLLLVPKYRRAFKHAIRMSDWDNLKYDDISKYWACLRRDYDYMGMNCDERIKLLKDNGLSIPVQRIVKIKQHG